MNTPDNWQTTATTHNPERAALWIEIFGQNRVPVKSFLPSVANLPGFTEPQSVYLLDLAVITDEQREKLIQAIAARFHLPAAEVAAGLDEYGVPLPISECTVSCSGQGLFFSMLDDYDDDFHYDQLDEDEWWLESDDEDDDWRARHGLYFPEE